MGYKVSGAKKAIAVLAMVLPSLLFFLVVSYHILNPPPEADYPPIWSEFISYVGVTLLCTSLGYPFLKKELDREEEERVVHLIKTYLESKNS